MRLTTESSNPSPLAVSARRVRKQGGNTTVEGAIIILPIMAIFFALMDFSVAIFVQNAFRNAVREGVRFAITQQTGASGQDAAVKAVVQDNSIGFLSNTNLISLQYYSVNAGTGALTAVSGVGSNAEGNVCVVTISGFSWAWMVPLWRSSTPLSITASSSDVMEAPPNGVLPSR